MKIQKMKIPAILGALLVAGTLSAGAQMNSDSLYKEPYRPQYHFSPEKGWIGDPSGFMYYQGKYHMYWWGKVESTDLVHYQQITPYAMTGADDNISYFTGSAVVDKNNTAFPAVLLKLAAFGLRAIMARSVLCPVHFLFFVLRAGGHNGVQLGILREAVNKRDGGIPEEQQPFAGIGMGHIGKLVGADPKLFG